MLPSVQRSFDDLGTPLRDVTFCVLDLETTGSAPDSCGITEIGAVLVRGGEVLRTFQTLVNPGTAIPPQITVLTGITQAMVLPAPRIEQVLPAFVELVGGAVVVGHNVRFDLAFLQAALERSGRPRLANRSVDTLALARRLLRDEVPNCRLGTLADRLRLPHRPSHRALDDAWATTDLLHLLLERAGSLGVTGLDDLLALPKLAGHPQVGMLRLTEGLPRAPGVYLFRDGAGRVLYVGKASDLRSRVRSYFSSDDRRKVGQLLREARAIDHRVCSSPLEAGVLEVRLVHEHEPRFNRQLRTWRAAAYLKLTRERFPRLSVVRVPRGDGLALLGPLPSTGAARRVADAVETAVPLRRCTARPGRQLRAAPCTAAQLGVATCPCAGTVDEAAYRGLVERVLRGLGPEPALLLDPLAERMARLAAAHRFEEAAEVRERARALTAALARQRRLDAVRAAGRMVVELPSGAGAELRHGRLVRAWGPGVAGAAPLPLLDAAATVDVDGSGPVPREQVDELLCVAAWLDEHAHRVRLVHVDRGWAHPLPALPRFEPRRPAVAAPNRAA